MNPMEPYIRKCFDCDVVLFDGPDIWISTPMAGHWLTVAEKQLLADYMAGQGAPEPAPLAVEATDPKPPKEENPAPKKRTHKERLKRQALTDQQRHQAGLIAFACVMAANLKGAGDALEVGVCLVKLRDKCALHARRVAAMTGDASPGLVKRTNTLYSHIRGIIARLGEVEGTGDLKATANDDGSFTLKYGPHSLHLG
jgi:hypothetical protein